MDKKDIERVIVDSLFLPERRQGNTLLNVPGVCGWFSSFKESYANRIALVDTINVDRAIRNAISFFEEKNCSFTWMVKPDDINASLPEKLMSHGLIPGGFHKAAGMHLEVPVYPYDKNSEIKIREVNGEEITANVPMIARACGAASEEYINTVYNPAAYSDVRCRTYLAFLDDKEQAVGFASFYYIENGSVVLLGGVGVVPEHRRKGIYAELLRQRFEDAVKDGIRSFMVQSARDSSYSMCARFGFEEICPLEFYRWSPQ
jgi:GNAT superfamily N-acetyltransferase